MLVLVKINKKPVIVGILGQNNAITLKSISEKCTKELTKCEIEELLFQVQFRLVTPLSRNFTKSIKYGLHELIKTTFTITQSYSRGP